MRRLKKFVSIMSASILVALVVCQIPQSLMGNKVLAASDTVSDTASLYAENNMVTMEGNDSFGAMLTDVLTAEQEEQEQNNGCNLFAVTVEDMVAYVEFETMQDATIVVGIYTESGEEMLGSGMLEVYQGEEEAYIDLVIDEMPEYFLLRAFMVNGDTLAPLCSSYESPMYTQEMQELLEKTTDDFEENRVLNLDEDKTNNFAVYKEDVLIVENNNEVNQIVSADVEEDVYIIENADESILGLEAGDIFAYEYENGEVLIVKVKNAETEGSAVTVTGQETELEEVFEYVKIDSEAGADQAQVNTDECGEGLVYHGLVDWTEEDEGGMETFALAGEQTYEKGLSYEFIDKPLVEGEAGSGSVSGEGSVKVSGAVTFSVKGAVKVNLSTSYQYIEWKIEYGAKVSVGISAEGKGKLRIGEIKLVCIPAVNFVLEPSIVLEVDAKLEFSGELSGSVGFSVEKDKGEKAVMKDISSTPKCDSEIKVEGTIFFGISLEPSLEIIDDCIVKVGIEAMLGAELKAEWSLSEEGDAEKHSCEACLDGEINAKAAVKFEAKLLNNEKWKMEKAYERTIKIADFYYSFTYDELGWGECPHLTYRINVTVTDKDGQPVKDARINDHYVTDADGKAVCYLVKGTHSLVVEKDGYDVTTKSVEVWYGDKEVAIVMGDDDEKGEMESNNRWTKVALGAFHGGVLTEDGDLYMWGFNGQGQLGDGTYESKYQLIKVMEDVREISMGERHSGAITENGDLYMWGYNFYGQIGDGSTEEFICTPVKVMEDVREISLGDTYSGAITENGDLYMWGDNGHGQIGDGTYKYKYEPVKIMKNVKKMSLGERHSGAITENGDLYMWGYNGFGQLGDGTTEWRDKPVKVMENVKEVSLSDERSGVLTENGDLYMCGRNYSGELGDGTDECKYEPVKVMGNVKEICLKANSSGAITENGDLYMWGSNYKGILGDGTNEDKCKPVKVMENVKEICLKTSHSGAITENGDLYMWGDNMYGRLGDGTTEDKYKPVKVMENVKDISLGSEHSGAMTENGELYTWGEKTPGDGTTQNKYLPTKIEKPSLTEYSVSSAAFLAANVENVSDTVTYSEVTPNASYIFCQLKSDTAENLLSPENLVYIAQETADAEGNIVFSYVLPDDAGKTMPKLSEPGFVDGMVDGVPLLYGDANMDGKVTSKDAVLMKKYLAGYEGLTIDLDAADVNADGEVTSKDAVRLLRYFAGYDVVLGE